MAFFTSKTIKPLTQEQELVKELIKSVGWKILEDKLKDRRSAALHGLMSGKDLNELIRAQAQVAELDWILKLPLTVLAGSKLN